MRRALVALGIPPRSRAELAEFVEILDPEDEGRVEWEPFLAVAALRMHARDDDNDDDGGDERRREVDEAFALFLGAGGRQRPPTGAAGDSSSAAAGGLITLGHLKRIAALLKEEGVKEEVLKDMILEANGGAGVGRGVRRDQFEEVMVRAGVWR